MPQPARDYLGSRRRFVFAIGSILCGPAFSRPQQEPTFTTRVKVVSVLATVVNKRGGIIRDLSKEDFALLEDGRPQSIRYFSRESDLPLTLGLMVDTSMSQEHVLDAERSASFRFLDQVLRPAKDKVFIMQFDMVVQTRQELTSSWKDLNDALASVDTPSRHELQNQTGGGTLLYDAVIAASKDVMLHQQGRKALIVLSDGVDTGSEASLATAIDAAQRADTLIYSILFSDPGAYGLFGIGIGGSDGKRVLMQMSRETGGGLFEVSKKLSIDKIFDLIQDELRSQYSIGYVSDKPVDISEFRKIQLKAKANGLSVQARDRYWAQP